MKIYTTFNDLHPKNILWDFMFGYTTGCLLISIGLKLCVVSGCLVLDWNIFLTETVTNWYSL